MPSPLPGESVLHQDTPQISLGGIGFGPRENTFQHRLHRGANCQANSVLYRSAISRMLSDPGTRSYLTPLWDSDPAWSTYPRGISALSSIKSSLVESPSAHP